MPIDGHLGCFQFLAIANKAAMNSHLWTSQYIGIGVLLCWVNTEECNVWLIWYIYMGHEVSMIHFLRNYLTKCILPFYILTSGNDSSSSTTSLPTLGMVNLEF